MQRSRPWLAHRAPLTLVWRLGRPLTSDAMLPASSSSGSLGPPGLKDKTRLTTSSASLGSPRQGQPRAPALPLAQHRPWGGGRGQRPGLRRPPLPPVPSVRPPRTHQPWPLSLSVSPAKTPGFSGGECVSSLPTCPRLLVTAAPIPGDPVRWALPPPFSLGCGRDLLLASFSRSSPTGWIGDAEIGARGQGLGSRCTGHWRNGLEREAKPWTRPSGPTRYSIM